MSIFPSSPSVGDEYSGYRWNGTVWEVIGIDLNTDYLTPTELQTYLNGNIDTDLIPDGNETRDLGEPSNKFRHLYLSSNSVYIGNTKLSATGGTVFLENTDVGPSSVTEIETTSGAQAKADAAAAAAAIVPDQTGNSGEFLTTDGTNTSWAPVPPSSPVGGGSDGVFYENDQKVTESYTITSGKNAMSTGPIDIASGVDVTIPSGSVWVIL